MKKIIEKLNSPRRSTRDLSTNILGTLVLAVLFALINHNFINKYNLISIGQNLAPYAMLSLGVLLPVSMGGIDLSVGTVCIGAAVFAGKLYEMGMPLVATIPAMMVFGALIGLINGYLIAKKKIQPFIATLGTMMLVRGATAIFANSATVLYPAQCWLNNVFSTYKGFPVSFIWIIFFSVILYFIFRKTKLGRYLTSIGSCEKATRISGVNVDKYTIIGYVGSGLMAGIAGIFWTASFATVTTATGNGMELDAVAAVYIGGTAAAGGLVNVFGCTIGSLMLVVIRSGLNFALARLNAPINSTYVTYVISGIIVVAAVLAEKTKNSSKSKKKLSNANSVAIKKIVSYILSIALVISLVAMGINFGTSTQEAAGTNEVKKISLAMKSEGSDYWDLVEAGAQKAGEEFGYEVLCRGTENEDASQLPKAREIVSTLLSENPTGFGIATIANGFTDLIEEAYDRNVPVIEFDNGLQSEDRDAIKASGKNPIHSHVVASNYNNGKLGGQKAYEAVRDDIIASDKYVVGIIQYGIITAADERCGGFRDGFLECSQADPLTKDKVEVIIEAKPSDKDNAYKAALEFLYEKDVDLVFCSSLYVINQAADAVQSAGGKYDGIKFVGFDTGEKGFEWMESDSKSPLLGIVSQDPYMIGYCSVKALVDINEGREIEEKIVVPGSWVTERE